MKKKYGCLFFLIDPFLLLHERRKQFILGISVILLMVFFIYFWKWTILFFFSFNIILSVFQSFGKVLGIRLLGAQLLYLLLFYIFWAIYIAVAPFPWYWILLHGALALSPFVLFTTLLNLSPVLYTKFLTSDTFDVSFWSVKPWIWNRINWPRIFAILEQRKFYKSMHAIVVYCLSGIAEKREVSLLALQQVAFNYWLTWPDKEDDKEPPYHSLGLKNYIGYTMAAKLLEAWFAQAQKEPAHYQMLFYFFEHFNVLLSEYIANPDSNFVVIDPEIIEERMNVLLLIFPENEQTEMLRTQLETARGLFMLMMGMAKELKSLPDPPMD